MGLIPALRRLAWKALKRTGDTGTAFECSLDRAVAAIGHRTTLLFMREAYYGTTRFEDCARRGGIT